MSGPTNSTRTAASNIGRPTIWPASAVLTPIAAAIVGRNGGSATNQSWLAAAGSTTAATDAFAERPSSRMALPIVGLLRHHRVKHHAPDDGSSVTLRTVRSLICDVLIG